MHVKIWISTVLLLLCIGVSAKAEPLKVAAAANLQKVFTEALIPAFEKKTGFAVLPTYGATKLLAVQLENGAPIDVFVAADTATVQKLAGERLLIASTVHTYAIGHLVLWSRKEAAHHPVRLADLTDPVYAHIAIANPKTAPYGLAAQETITKLGLSAKLAPRLVQAENIGQALQFAQSGNADVALTALSLVIQDKTNPYSVVDDNLHAPITQSLGLVRTTTLTTQALAFINYLTGKDTDKIWKSYGYSLPKRP